MSDISKDTKTMKGAQEPSGPGGIGAPGVPGKKKKVQNTDCGLVPNINAKTLPFAPFVPFIICICIFIYTFISSESVGNPNTYDGPQPILLFLTVGFIIIFFNGFFNHKNTTAGKYYDRVINQSPNMLVKTLVTIESLLTTPVDKIQCTVVNRWIEYYNYPFNYMIFAGALIVICVTLLGYYQTAIHKFGPDDLSPGNSDANGIRSSPDRNRVKYYLAVNPNKNPSAVTNMQQWNNNIKCLSIIGIVYALTTNYMVIKALDSDDTTKYVDPVDPKKTIVWGGGASIKKSPNPKNTRQLFWILRLVSWGIGIAGIMLAGYNLNDYIQDVGPNLA